ncbi:MAG: hypothetical protein WC284_09205 [Candidimonas sp.]
MVKVTHHNFYIDTNGDVVGYTWVCPPMGESQSVYATDYPERRYYYEDGTEKTREGGINLVREATEAEARASKGYAALMKWHDHQQFNVTHGFSH